MTPVPGGSDKPTVYDLVVVLGERPGEFMRALDVHRYVIIDRDNIQPFIDAENREHRADRNVMNATMLRHALNALNAHHKPIFPVDTNDCPICALPLDFGHEDQ